MTVLGWLVALWVAAGLEALTGGMPGPLLLVAVAAGLWSGTRAGVLVGFGAGLCDGVLGGQHLALYGLLAMLCGGGASLLTRWFSRENLLVAIVIGALCSLLVGAVLSVPLPPAPAAVTAVLRRTLENGLWMTVIYGILLLASPGTTSEVSREY